MTDLDKDVDSIKPGRFMDRVAFNMLFRYMKIDTDEVRSVIVHNKDLWEDVPAHEWQTWGKRVKKLRLQGCITVERFEVEFKKRRPDIWNVYISEPNARNWLIVQVMVLRLLLGVDQPNYQAAKQTTS